MDYGLAKVADLMIKNVISLAVNYRSPVLFVDEIVQDAEVMTGAVLKIVPTQDPKVDHVMLLLSFNNTV